MGASEEILTLCAFFGLGGVIYPLLGLGNGAGNAALKTVLQVAAGLLAGGFTVLTAELFFGGRLSHGALLSLMAGAVFTHFLLKTRP